MTTFKPESPPTNTKPRGALALSVDPVFGSLFWGKLISSAGVWVHSIVAAIVIFAATGSALMVGLVSVVQFAPQMLFSMWSGKWADRGHAPRQILIGRILCASGSGSLAIWLWLHGTEGAFVAPAVLIASLVVGLGFVVGGPAMQSIIPRLIRPGELATAMALNTAPMTTARIIGPALGAYAAVHLGAATAFGFAACTHLIFATLVVIVRFPDREVRAPGFDYSVRTALRHVLQDRPLLILLAATAAAGIGSEPSMTLAPAMAQTLDGSTQLVGELTMAFGVGAAIGLVIISTLNKRIRPAVATVAGLWSLSIGLLGVAVSGGVWLVLIAFSIAGFGFSWTITGASTLIQERSPAELRGRIMALWMIAFVGSRPLAATLVGSAADVFSVRTSFVITAALLALTAILCRPRAVAASS